MNVLRVLPVMSTQLAPTQLDLSHVHAMLGITEMAHLVQVSLLFKFLLQSNIDLVTLNGWSLGYTVK